MAYHPPAILPSPLEMITPASRWKNSSGRTISREYSPRSVLQWAYGRDVPLKTKKYTMKTTILVAAAMLSLPLGVMAAPAADAGSAITADEAKAEVINLKVKNMR
jgi:hypothetical protein